MSTPRKFTFKRFKRNYEEDGFDGFSPENLSSATINNNSKLEILNEKIKEINPEFVLKNHNISDFEGFTDEDISEGTDYFELYHDLYQKKNTH